MDDAPVPWEVMDQEAVEAAEAAEAAKPAEPEPRAAKTSSWWTTLSEFVRVTAWTPADRPFF